MRTINHIKRFLGRKPKNRREYMKVYDYLKSIGKIK